MPLNSGSNSDSSASVGAWQHPGTLDPLAAATLGAAITTWSTFLPCFLLVLLGAPYIEQLRGIRWLGPVLATITAAVVGVILNLAVWLGWQFEHGRSLGGVFCRLFKGSRLKNNRRE